MPLYIKASLRDLPAGYRQSCLQLELSLASLLTSSLHLLSFVEVFGLLFFLFLFCHSPLFTKRFSIYSKSTTIFAYFFEHTHIYLPIWLLALAKLGVWSFVPGLAAGQNGGGGGNSMGRIHELSARLLLFYFGLSLLSCLLFSWLSAHRLNECASVCLCVWIWQVMTVIWRRKVDVIMSV